jgi:MFS family permease
MQNQNGRKVLPVLFVTLLLDMIGTGMIIPLIPSLFTDPSSPAFLLAGHGNQYQLLMAGLVVALFGIMQFVAVPCLILRTPTICRLPRKLKPVIMLPAMKLRKETLGKLRCQPH